MMHVINVNSFESWLILPITFELAIEIWPNNDTFLITVITNFSSKLNYNSFVIIVVIDFHNELFTLDYIWFVNKNEFKLSIWF